MTNSTKLTDISGASEALPQKKEDARCWEFQPITDGFNDCLERVYCVHLEVDVEEMAKSMYEAERYFSWEEAPESVKMFRRERAKKVIDKTVQWARLVRK